MLLPLPPGSAAFPRTLLVSGEGVVRRGWAYSNGCGDRYEVGDGCIVAVVLLVSRAISDRVKIPSHRLSLETPDVSKILTVRLCERPSTVLL